MTITPITNLRGPAARIVEVTGELVPADAPFEVIMDGPDQGRSFHFKNPRGLPGVNAIENDAAVAAYVAASDSETATQLRQLFTRRAAMPVNVLDYATTFPSDQTAEFQAAVDAVPTGGALTIPAGVRFRIDGQINISKPITIHAPGSGGVYSGLTGTAAQTIFNVTSSHVHFKGVRIEGPQFAVQAMQYGIKFTGTVSNPLVNISVVGCEISKLAYFGIFTEHVVDIRFDENRVYDIGYAAIMVLSTDGGSIDRNNIRNVIKATGYADAYGISVTRAYGSLAAVPRSKNLSISSNRIADIPSWVGIDSHAGQNLKIDGNIITNTYFPISCVSSRLVGTGVYDLACLDVSITNNLCDSTVSDGTRGPLNLIGNAIERGTGVIRGNRVRGHGLQLNSQGSGIAIDYTRGVIIADNTSVESGVTGILAVSNNEGFIITGNVVIDPWSESTNIVKGIWSNGDYNTGYIGDNQLLINTKVAAKTLANGLGIAVTNFPNTTITVGPNRAAVAATPLWDTGARTRFGLFGSSGAAKPASPGNATGADAAVVNALTTALRNYGMLT